MLFSRPLRQLLPVKVLGRLIGYLLTVLLTVIVVIILSQFDFSKALGQGHVHGHRNHGVERRGAGAAPNNTQRQPAHTGAAPKPSSAPGAAAIIQHLGTTLARAAMTTAAATKRVTATAAAPATTAAVTTGGAVGYESKYAPPPGGCKEMKKMIVLHWDPHWDWHRNPNGLKEFMDCEKSKVNRCITWYTTSDRSFTSKADIIVAHDWSGYPALPERAFPTQLFMYMTMESPYSGFSSQHLQHLFNLEYKYMLSSHVRAAYIPIGEKSFTEIHGASHFSFKQKVANAVSSLVSNCGGFVPRSDFMRDLNEQVPIHGFGRCFHNHELSSYHDISTLEKYKVAMVFENSLCYDYVTEKWWRALTQATIPLVTSNDRVPDYTKYAPDLNCYLDYGRFKDMAALATEIKKIMNDEEVYNKYMAYRTWPEEKFNPVFRKHFSSSSCADFCRLGQKMLDNVEMDKLVKRRNPKDESCRPHGILH
eukprot:scpid55223/ scgid19550/ Alpha-(1,3)-fucosyltransferase; Fucosyltransferase 7; Fucosyltransferase VII; Galactoside 3-L-fucosyltransferase; Selectin ligand synthase